MKSPFCSYYGGKSRLAKKIIPLFCEHGHYIEAFCGAAWLFFKKRPSRIETLNDYNGRVANVYRVIRDNPEELCRLAELAINSREFFNEYKKLNPASVSPELDAWAFLYVNSYSFAGNHSTWGYRVGRSRPLQPLQPPSGMAALFCEAHERLKNAQIENASWERILERYDGPENLFYLDPPYYGHENDYGKNLFQRHDFARMASVLRKLEGKFILSINDLPETRGIFHGFNLMELSATYSCGGHLTGRRGEKRRELLIANYDWPVPDLARLAQP